MIADFWFGKTIKTEKAMNYLLAEAAKKAKSTPLQIASHVFSPYGMTGIILLAESHIAIHTWPEISYIAIDIFTCGSGATPRKAIGFLKKQLRPNIAKVYLMKRGKMV
ncbi:MAG: adenosylmethionine decarboxylase [Candidatus Wildermuthbacteria bacterium]|nr:adenosylmethionine decarboxylase [Candidatus Wildermuthbacteria bacterium]